MSWIYYNSNNNEYRFALGNVQDNPKRLLFCFGINPSKAAPPPEKLDPTAKRIEKIAKEHGYDSWIILNVCAKRSTSPDDLCKNELFDLHKKNIDIISMLLNEYRDCSDILFAFGDSIEKRSYLKKHLCEIICAIKSACYSGNFYCLGKTKKGNARHPLYQKANTPFVPFSTDELTYSIFSVLNDNLCVIQEYSFNGGLISETIGFYDPK